MKDLSIFIMSALLWIIVILVFRIRFDTIEIKNKLEILETEEIIIEEEN